MSASFLDRWRGRAGPSAPARLPDGLRAYAVGDIHGRFDLLERLYGQIRRDLQEEPPRESVEIFLGDYLDRGEQSCQVVEWMISAEPACNERICLLGNHEDMLLQALADPSAMQHWLRNGGLETVLSYKPIPRHILAGMPLSKAHAEFRAAIPDTHLGFLRGLRRSAELGDYLFVHAGLRPGRTVEGQDPADLIWIREPFHSSSFDFGRIVVHGHTPVAAPEVRPNRINIDTGAVFTGRLTCLVLEGDSRRFMHTGSA